SPIRGRKRATLASPDGCICTTPARPASQTTGGAHKCRIASPLEELVRGRTLRLLLCLVGLEPCDLLAQQCDALVELLDREQGQILPDLVRDFLLRPVVFVDHWHGAP